MRYLWCALGLTISLCMFGGSAASALAAGDANQTACPASTEASPGFRSYLPDCRAYELVTPGFKYGAPAFAQGVAPEGSAIQFNSLGAFGEVEQESTTTGSRYIARRNANGWAATPMNPSSAIFRPDDEYEISDFSSDLSSALIRQAPWSASPVDTGFYIREIGGETYTKIGPAISPEAVAAWTPEEDVRRVVHQPAVSYDGAAGNFSHVLFSIVKPQFGVEPINWYWPGDQTRLAEERLSTGTPLSSLYEYSGAADTEPELVGVRNSTALTQAASEEGKLHINEAAEQISACNTWLGRQGGSNVSQHNAIADAGETIFFTAGACALQPTEPKVAELYARVGRSRTVAISEPSESQCVECRTEHSKQPVADGAAEFAGASADGSKVFFTTEQELLPGGSGDSLYEYDFAAPEGHKVTLVAGALAPGGGVSSVSGDGSHVYFVSTGAIAGLSANQYGTAPSPGADNLYVWNAITGQYRFIAALSEEDSGDWAAGGVHQLDATPDGRYLVFVSVADPTKEGTSGSQGYRYDAETEELLRVTVGVGGYNQDGDAGPVSGALLPALEAGGGDLAQPPAVSISADGSQIFFQSPVGLTPLALNDACALESEGGGECKLAMNVYEWHAGNVYLLSDGQDTHGRLRRSAVSLDGASADGRDVFITSADALVPQDQSPGQVEVYDIRVEGGFPAPEVATPCAGEACQPAATPPVLSTPGSMTFSGAGNLAAPPTAPPTPVKKTKVPTRAEKLAKALRVCKKKSKKKRAKCEKQANKSYGKAK
jgi:hypothetical protein